METDASFVAAGVGAHKDVHVLCVIDALGRKVHEGAFPATASGYRNLVDAEKAAHVATRDAYEAFLDEVEKRNNAG